MDNVPVKIAENYKAPPLLYHLPQSVANKLLLASQHYLEAPQFSYDFQLERKVLAKIPEWRRMRHQEREQRRERKENREQQQIRDIEAQQKQALGAVTYPSAEDLSIASDEEVENGPADGEQLQSTAEDAEQPITAVPTQQTCSFHNILQPTILPAGADSLASWHAGNLLNASKFSNAFNYKDFEDDTSSPFDNIELKTINDLDILAQVLHNTQLKANKEKQTIDELQQAKEHRETPAAQGHTEEENSNATDQLKNTEENNQLNAANLSIIENTKAALEKVDFNDFSWQPQNENENIPNATTAAQSHPHTIGNSYAYSASTYAPFSNQQTQPLAYIPYNGALQFNGLEQQPQYTNYNLHHTAYNNQNYLYSSHCNGGGVNGTGNFINATNSPQDIHFVGHNANRYLSPNHSTANDFNGPQAVPQRVLLSEAELKLKSKSVPDILRELRDEVRNSEMRRSRNYSINLDDGKEQPSEAQAITPQKTPVKAATPQCFDGLEASAQKLARNISSMGFPLERVSKITQMFGADDKKIIEHLIPLSELMDLGFEETQISEALVKFDNNKEKALEYLIS